MFSGTCTRGGAAKRGLPRATVRSPRCGSGGKLACHEYENSNGSGHILHIKRLRYGTETEIITSAFSPWLLPSQTGRPVTSSWWKRLPTRPNQEVEEVERLLADSGKTINTAARQRQPDAASGIQRCPGAFPQPCTGNGELDMQIAAADRVLAIVDAELIRLSTDRHDLLIRRVTW